MASLQACYSHSHHLQNHSDDSSSVALMSWPGLSGDQPPSKSSQRVTLEQKHFYYQGNSKGFRSLKSGTSITQEVITALGALSQEQGQKLTYTFIVIPHVFTLVCPIQKRKQQVCTTYEALSILVLPSPIYLHTSAIPVWSYTSCSVAFPNHALFFFAKMAFETLP